jgi:hypothetical protein
MTAGLKASSAPQTCPFRPSSTRRPITEGRGEKFEERPTENFGSGQEARRAPAATVTSRWFSRCRPAVPR